MQRVSTFPQLPTTISVPVITRSGHNNGLGFRRPQPATTKPSCVTAASPGDESEQGEQLFCWPEILEFGIDLQNIQHTVRAVTDHARPESARRSAEKAPFDAEKWNIITNELGFSPLNCAEKPFSKS
jgi:hypothetical protein